MENVILNETPIRTSKNFNINNIKIESSVIPSVIGKFDNIEILNNNPNIKIEQKTFDTDLSYGLGKIFTDQVNQNGNNGFKININGKNSEDFIFNFKFDNKNTQLVENIEIISEKRSCSNLIIKYESEKDLECYHNGIINVLAKEDSEINIIFVNLLNNNSNNFISIQNEIKCNAKVNYTIIDFGGKNSITNYYSNIVGENAENNVNTIYLGKENQFFDLNYIAHLKGEKSNVNIDVVGAISQNAKKHFKGTIDFKKGAKKAKGNENEYCMILSDTAKSIALPMLLCSEEDVEGNHSSAAGKIGEKGFNKKDALKLMVRARFNNVLENIRNQILKEQILEEIDSRLE